eukprot:CAMPEP_0119377016 /NCGR_PEP_ID=MMETSP1334-20130426/42584_1 /TAXON_ID=127549 /ORGANISM="Calcidiscus leptoporus, Strain RCC1130" /LENGTH=75 /DNA_ID=CAMNT_0007395775 /DNA_START=53 /DNA_END=280 /DNA_ORIENTATION=+
MATEERAEEEAAFQLYELRRNGAALSASVQSMMRYTETYGVDSDGLVVASSRWEVNENKHKRQSIKNKRGGCSMQ